jgi:hypothetical protein
MISIFTQPRTKALNEVRQLTLWRIEVAPFPVLSNVATPQKLSSPSQSLYMDMGMVMVPKKGVPSRIWMIYLVSRPTS